MPLPAALLKKLAKRGIVNDAKGSSAQKEQEEIIAEDYDDVSVNPENYNHPVSKRNENFWVERLKRRLTTQKITGVKGCPNKYNVHHTCILYCVEKFGEGNPNPSKAYKKRFKRLLDRYPLPEKPGVHDWVTIYDPGCSAYYFWNKVDDTVSWLPPKHPKADLTKSAATLRREMDEKPDLEDNETDQPQQDEDHVTEEIPERYKTPNPPPKKTKSRDLEKILKSKHNRRSNQESEKLDPMDPAAYSDCPRGKWSSGLNADEKSAADHTASGTLFQMRPYPSPGDILRANKRRNNSDDERDDDDRDYSKGYKHSRESDRRRSRSDSE